MFSFLSFILLFFIGILTGLFSGLFGGGGGIITNPLIWSVFSYMDFPSQVVVQITFGTTVASMMITAILGSCVHHRHKNIWWEVIPPLVTGGMLGSLMGATAASYSPGVFLKVSFGFLQLIVAYFMIANKKLSSSSSEDPIKRWEYILLLGLGIGFIGSFMGIGGGAIAVPIMVLLLRYPMDKTAGISCTMIAFNSTVATMAYIYNGWGNDYLPPYSLGYVNGVALMILISSSLIFVTFGASRVRRIKSQILQRIFGFILIISGIKIVFSNLINLIYS